MALISQVVTYSCVSMLHFNSGPTVALHNQHANSQSIKKNWHSFISGHLFSDISLHSLSSTVYNKVPTQSWIHFLFEHQTVWKNTILVHFIHSVWFTCTWVPTSCTSGKDTKRRAQCWRRWDTMKGLMAYSSRFIPPSYPPLSCC